MWERGTAEGNEVLEVDRGWIALGPTGHGEDFILRTVESDMT